MADAQFPLGFFTKLYRITDASAYQLDNELGHRLFRFRAVVRVRDGFAAIVERVRHSPHGFGVKCSRVKNGYDIDHGCLPVLFQAGAQQVSHSPARNSGPLPVVITPYAFSKRMSV
jgi:hypothetical protein